MYRQGDLLFIKIDEPGDKVIRRTTKDILRSSLTGHSHTLTDGFVWESGNLGRFYVEVPNGAQVVHQEHRPIPLEPGWYEVRRQREVTGYVTD